MDLVEVVNWAEFRNMPLPTTGPILADHEHDHDGATQDTARLKQCVTHNLAPFSDQTHWTIVLQVTTATPSPPSPD